MKKVTITSDDLKQESLRQGLDPDCWNYSRGKKGWEVRKGFMIVGDLIFEDHAKILVDALNKK